MGASVWGGGQLGGSIICALLTAAWFVPATGVLTTGSANTHLCNDLLS